MLPFDWVGSRGSFTCFRGCDYGSCRSSRDGSECSGGVSSAGATSSDCSTATNTTADDNTDDDGTRHTDENRNNNATNNCPHVNICEKEERLNARITSHAPYTVCVTTYRCSERRDGVLTITAIFIATINTVIKTITFIIIIDTLATVTPEIKEGTTNYMVERDHVNVLTCRQGFKHDKRS